MSEKTEEKKGCCSFFSCCGGCLAGSLVTVLLVVGLGVGGYYYLPGYLEAQVAKGSAIAQNEPAPEKVVELERKISAFGGELAGQGPLDVTVTLTDAELNAWIAANALGPKAPVRLDNARIALADGSCQLFLRARGSEFARQIPETQQTRYLRQLLQRTGVVDVAASLSASVRDGAIAVQVESLRVGPLPLPAFMANGVVERALEGRTLRFDGITVADLQMKPGKLLLRATRDLR